MDAEVETQLKRYEIVEWFYDGLNGKIIPWTLENGGTSHDPSAQAFVLHGDGTVLARAPGGQLRQKSQFAKWLGEQADLHEKKYPPTRVPLVRAEVVKDGDGVRCAALDVAREASQPVLLYFGRSEQDDLDRKLRSEVKAARKFEKGALDSKKAAEAAEGWTLLRFDLGNEAAAALAATWEVEKAPALVIWPVGAEAPIALPSRMTGASLAYQLKKYTP